LEDFGLMHLVIYIYGCVLKHAVKQVDFGGNV
jgi:hypothetical protein